MLEYETSVHGYRDVDAQIHDYQQMKPLTSKDNLTLSNPLKPVGQKTRHIHNNSGSLHLANKHPVRYFGAGASW
jgi:hypothetical protein